MSLKKKIIIGILFFVLVFPAFLLTIKIIDVLHRVELDLIDLRFKLRGELPAWDQVVIVEIDTASLDKLSSWPWPRRYYGDLVRILNKHGAKVIGFDVLFDSTSSIGKEEDEYFGQALKEFDNVILASKWVNVRTKQFSSESWSIPIPELNAHAVHGFANKYIDSDNTVRKSYFLFSRPNRPYQFSLDIQMMANYYGYSQKNISANPEQKEILLGDLRIPLESSSGLFRINFVGAERSFTHIPFYQVLEERYPNMSIFKDKIVYIGATDAILHDFFFTPFGKMSGVEIHANALHTIFKKTFLSQQNRLFGILVCLILMGLVILIALKTKAVTGLFLATTTILLYSIYATYAFVKFNIFVFWIYPIFFSVLAYFIVVFIRFIKEEQQKRMIKGAFQQYVSPTVVEELIKDPSKLKLGGEKRELTVFFSDIRAFTTYSENHTPEEVVDVLNEYLDAMTLIIFKWKGTLDKYVGDEVMAIWGAPLAQENHVELAVRCCWEQLAVLRELQEKWKAEGKDIVDIGMGLNTGEMITGNIGSSVHKDYTVIGDAVNLGARLEAETRNHGTPEEPCYLIISEFTYAHIKDIVTVKALGSVKVKGKNKPVEIYEVLDVKEKGKVT